MGATELLYLENLNILEVDAQVLESYIENRSNTVILNRTAFYPQGGGQPCDTGIIESNNIVNSSLKTIVKFVNKQELLGIYGFAPDYITNMGKIRVIMFGNFGIPCGGTHVHNLRDINKIIIRKIKINQGSIRVAYEVDA